LRFVRYSVLGLQIVNISTKKATIHIDVIVAEKTCILQSESDLKSDEECYFEAEKLSKVQGKQMQNEEQ
jgi:hypothetical protein